MAPPVQNARFRSVIAGRMRGALASMVRWFTVRHCRSTVGRRRNERAVIDVPEQRSVLSGIGISRIGRRTGIPALELTTEAATAAIADAGLQPGDIDGISTMGDTPLADAAAALGIEPGYTGGGFDTGGLLSPVMAACFAVAAGRARHVLVYRTVQMIGGSIAPAPPPKNDRQPKAPPPPRAEGPSGEAASALGRVMGDMAPLLAYHAYSAANWLAMHCQRHMHLYGTTKEQLGWLAINSRRNAAHNPRAVYRDPITMDDYLGARMISTPFGLLDCDVPIDGSIAFVVSAAEHAADCPNLPLRVAAIGGASAGGGWYHAPGLPEDGVGGSRGRDVEPHRSRARRRRRRRALRRVHVPHVRVARGARSLR